MEMTVEQLMEWMSGEVKRNTLWKPSPVSLCPPQIPHDLVWDWTRAATVGTQRVTGWATALPTDDFTEKHSQNPEVG
jgi:hypothetical protein